MAFGPDYDYDDPDDEGRIGDYENHFADPGGRSALRASSGDRCPSCKKRVARRALHCSHCGFRLNPRIHPCPQCGRPKALTPVDKAKGYRCDACADKAERGCD